MSIAIKKAKLYFKLVLIVAVVMTAGLILLKNNKHQATVWFFKEYTDVNVLSLMLMTAVASIISFWVLSKIFKVWSEWREISRLEAEQEKQGQLEERIKALDDRERRIDDKVERALSERDD